MSISVVWFRELERPFRKMFLSGMPQSTHLSEAASRACYPTSLVLDAAMETLDITPEKLIKIDFDSLETWLLVRRPNAKKYPKKKQFNSLLF